MKRISSKSILDDLRRQVHETGSGLVKLESRARAEACYRWLSCRLPDDYGVWIIDAPGRENEVNIFRQCGGRAFREGDSDWLNRRSTNAVRAPEKFKRWRRRNKL